MKRFAVILLCAVLAFTAVACEDGEFYAGDMPNDVKNEETEKKEYVKVDTQEFMSALGKSLDEDVGLEVRYDIEKCVEVTPEGVFEATGVQFFKFIDDFSSFLIKDGVVMEACPSFGGMGFSDAIQWDYDQNGVDDLLVAGSWGSGMHRATLTLWDMVKMEKVEFLTGIVPTSFFNVGELGLEFVDVNDPKAGIRIYSQGYAAGSSSKEPIKVKLEDIGEFRLVDGSVIYVPLQDSATYNIAG